MTRSSSVPQTTPQTGERTAPSAATSTPLSRRELFPQADPFALPAEVSQAINDAWVKEHGAHPIIKLRGVGRTDEVVRREMSCYKLGADAMNAVVTEEASLLTQPNASQDAHDEWVSRHLGDSASRRTALPLRGDGRNNEAVKADILLVISGAKYALSRSPHMRLLRDELTATTARADDLARQLADATEEDRRQEAAITKVKEEAVVKEEAAAAAAKALTDRVNELEARREAEAEAKGALEARLAESQAELEQLRRTTTAAADALQAEVRKGRRLIVLVSLTFALLAYVTLAAPEQLPGWFATASTPPELSAPAITLVVVLHVALLLSGATWALYLGI